MLLQSGRRFGCHPAHDSKNELDIYCQPSFESMESQSLRRIQKEAKLNSWQPDIVPLRAKLVPRVAEVVAAAEVLGDGAPRAAVAVLQRAAPIAALRARAAVHPHAAASRVLAANTARVQARTSSGKCTSSSAAVSKWAAVERK